MAWHYVEQVGHYWSYTDQRVVDNAFEIWNYLGGIGFTLESVCGILGNIWRESHVNPGQKETGAEANGWGLIQWTPSSTLKNHVTPWYDGAKQVELIYKEMFLIPPFNQSAHRVWFSGGSYSFTGLQFSKLTSIETATRAYCLQRERPGVTAMDERIEYANKFYELLSGHPPRPTTNYLYGGIRDVLRRLIIHA